MDKDTYDRGLSMRRKVLGEDYVDRALKSADDFNRDFQRFVTQYCWGEAWGDDTLSPRERSILNLARENGGIPDPHSRRVAQRPHAQ